MFWAVAFTLLAGSCTMEEVEVLSLNKVEVQGFSNNTITVKVTATIKNPNAKIVIKASELKLLSKKDEIGRIVQTEKIILDRNSTKQYTTLVKVELTQLKGGIMTALSMFNGKKADIKLNGWVKVSSTWYGRTIKFNDYPIQL